jgi:hypothetical protein
MLLHTGGLWKYDTECVIRASGLPYTVIRCTGGSVVIMSCYFAKLCRAHGWVVEVRGGVRHQGQRSAIHRHSLHRWVLRHYVIFFIIIILLIQAIA